MGACIAVLILAQVCLLVLLYVLFFIGIYSLLQAGLRQRAVRYRLRYKQDGRWHVRFAGWLARYRPVYKHLKLLLEAAQSRIGMGLFLAVSGILLLVGLTVGALFFQSLKGVTLLGGMMGGMPYVALRFNIISIRLRNRLEFLPAVEIFYQYYMVSGSKNVKTALQLVLAEQRIRYPIKTVFDQLHRNLLTSREEEESLRLFTMTLGHVWADYFAGMFRVALLEGNDITENLRDLIEDMRRAQRADQAERNRLLEIRVANFTPILFLALFLFLNFKTNPTNAYTYYVLDAEGRNLILDALLLIGVSFLMGIYLSMKRM